MSTNDDIQQIAIDQIIILNPRSRNKRLFSTIVANIDHVGLKRPSPSPTARRQIRSRLRPRTTRSLPGARRHHHPSIIITATKEDGIS